MRGIDAAMFNQLPPSGVDSGMILWAQSHRTSDGVQSPLRLSQTSSIRSGGSSCGRVIRTLSPSCQRVHACRFASGLSTGGSGRVARMALRSAFSHGWSTVFVLCRTP